MTNVITKSLLERYLSELAEDEVKIQQAAEAYEREKATLEVSLRRYIALRDFVTEQIGESPYSPVVTWPFGLNEDRGRFRFTSKAVGDAVLEVLQERKLRFPEGPWMTLRTIIETLSEGGLGFPEPVQARAVNAALLKVTGRKRSTDKDGTVYYSVGEEGGTPIDPDDLPFE
jgi:hypothetical protein